MDKEKKILIVEDSAEDAEMISRELGKGDFAYTTKWVKSKDEFLKALGGFVPDMILCDYKMPTLGAPEAWEIVKKRCPETPFIVVSGTIGEDIAVEMMKSGVVDYVLKDRLIRLLPAVQRAFEEVKLRTHRKQAEQLLRKIEENALSLTDAAQDAILMMDPRGAISFWNPAAQRILGYSIEEALGKDLHQFIAPGRFHSAHAAAYPEFLRTGQGAAVGKTVELAALRKDGVEIPVSLSLSAAKREDGWHAVGILRDITEQKRVEKELESLSRKNELILSSMGEGILGLDLEGQHTFVNPAAAEMLGYQAGELLGRSGHSLWHHSKADGSPRPEEECKIYAAFQDGKVHRSSGEVFWRKDGTRFDVEYASTPILEGGRLVGAVVTFTDITKRRKMEEESERRLQELEVFYKACVGREERIVELKKEIATLKDKLDARK